MVLTLDDTSIRWEKDFDIRQSDGQSLQLLLALGEGVAHWVVGTTEGKVLGLMALSVGENWESQLDTWQESYPWIFETSWHQVKIAVPERYFSLIPAQIFSAGMMNDYRQYLFDLEQDESVYYVLHGKTYANLFSGSTHLIDLLYQRFGDEVEVFPTSAALLEGFIGNFHLVNEELDLMVYVQSDRLFLLIKRQGQLLFCQQYPYTNPDQAAFHILTAMKQLGLNPQKDILSLYGLVDKESAIYQSLYRFVRFVDFGASPAFMTLSNTFDDYAAYGHFAAMGLHLCRQ